MEDILRFWLREIVRQLCVIRDVFTVYVVLSLLLQATRLFIEWLKGKE